VALLLATDPVDLALGPDGDLALDASGSPYLVSGLDAVVQTCRMSLQLIRGEWFLDLQQGVPYFENQTVTEDQALLGQVFDERKALVAFRDALLAAPGVVEVLQLSVSFDNSVRTLAVTWAVRTQFGDTPADTLAVASSAGATP
jgi:hypothetical protein